MSFVYKITDQLTGYSYTAGAIAAATSIYLAPQLPEAAFRVYNLVPRFVINGAAGYAVGLASNDDCAVLKGVAGGIAAEVALAALSRATA